MKKLSLTVVLAAMTLLGCKKVNRPPDRPFAPDCIGWFGSTHFLGRVGEDELFYCNAADPDGDDLRYRVDWGDGDTSDWTEPAPNGQGAYVRHSWDSTGTFFVRSQAIDEDGVLSDWSEATAISMAFAWRQTYGGASDDEAASVRPTYDGGYIVAGTTNSFGAGLSDVWLVQVDARGAKMWDKTYGGPADDRGCSVLQTYFGDFIIAGRTCSKGAGGSDAWLIRVDLDGNVIWDRTFGGPGNDYAVSVQQTFDAGFIVAGVTCSDGAGGEDAWLIRTDASGNLVWSRTYGGASSDVAASVWQTSDRGFVVTGTTDSCHSRGKDVWLIKTDSFGSVQWSKTFGGIEDDYAGSGQQTSDGGYVIAGTRGVDGGDMWLIKTDARGEMLWSEAFGGSLYDEGSWVAQTFDGGYVVAGRTCRDTLHPDKSDVMAALTNAFGQGFYIPCGGREVEYGVCAAQTSDGSFVIAGNTFSSGAGMCDVWLIKTDWALGPWVGSQPDRGMAGARLTSDARILE